MVLLLLVVIFVPRPEIRIADATFDALSCDPASGNYVAMVHVTLVNTGGVDGDVWVRFHVDTERRATMDVFVSARSSAAATLNATITGCSYHQYSVDTCIPTGKSMTC